MTDAATGRERSGIALHLMDVVACRAGHRRAALKTPARFEQADLVAVNIRLGRVFVMQAGVAASAKLEAGGPRDLFVPIGFSVALATSDTQRVVAGVTETGGGLLQAESGSVAVETFRWYAATEMHRSIPVAGAIDPSPGAGVIGHGQLEQQSVLPVEIRLAAPARANYEVESLGLRAASLDTRLVEAFTPPFHPEVDVRNAGGHDVAATVE